MIGAASLTADELRDEIRAVRQLTDRPFGVDILFATARRPAADVVTVANADDQGTILRLDPINGDDTINPGSLRGPRSNDGDLDTADEEKPDIAAHGTTIKAPDFNTTNGYQIQW